LKSDRAQARRHLFLPSQMGVSNITSTADPHCGEGNGNPRKVVTNELGSRSWHGTRYRWLIKCLEHALQSKKFLPNHKRKFREQRRAGRSDAFCGYGTAVCLGEPRCCSRLHHSSVPNRSISRLRHHISQQ